MIVSFIVLYQLAPTDCYVFTNTNYTTIIITVTATITPSATITMSF